MYNFLKYLLLIFIIKINMFVYSAFDYVIFEARNKMSIHLMSESIAYTESVRKEICGKLDQERIREIMDKIYSFGKNEIKKGNINIGEFELNCIESIFVTLWQPNWVLNTEGDYESYESSIIYSSLDEFKATVQNRGRELYYQLIEYFEQNGGDKDKLLKRTGIGSRI